MRLSEFDLQEVKVMTNDLYFPSLQSTESSSLFLKLGSVSVQTSHHSEDTHGQLRITQF